MPVTNQQILEAVESINKRLDKMNGKIEEHEKRLGLHDVFLAKLEVSEEHHSVNWDRVANVILTVINLIIAALLAGLIKP